MDTIWQLIVANGSSLLLGAVGGGLVSGVVGWRMLRSDTARKLLEEALAMQREMEAWILEGDPTGTVKLSTSKGLPTVPPQGGQGLWLRPVEVRAVLDEATWNSPADPFYDFIDGRRTWIVRDSVSGGSTAYSGFLKSGWRPVLVSGF